jgi:hypothetical protein
MTYTTAFYGDDYLECVQRVNHKYIGPKSAKTSRSISYRGKSYTFQLVEEYGKFTRFGLRIYCEGPANSLFIDIFKGQRFSDKLSIQVDGYESFGDRKSERLARKIAFYQFKKITNSAVRDVIYGLDMDRQYYSSFDDEYEELGWN